LTYCRDNSFIDLKILYFLELDYNAQKELVIWGAGKRGKKVAQLLKESNISFVWVCNNDRKIGQEIFQTRMQDCSNVNYSNKQVILTIANESEQLDVLQILKDFKTCIQYWFC
jgi:UDP-N-acetylmuramoylalanine-D-glutamate ligase